MDTNLDDGSLAFLNIPRDENNKHLKGADTNQQKLTNLTFRVTDFIKDIKTKFGEKRYLVQIEFDDPIPSGHEKIEKFFTNSKDIKYIIDEIEKRKAFPRRVTMHSSGNRYYFE